MTAAVVVALVVQAAGLLGLLITDVLTRRRELELRLTERKQQLYAEFMAAMIAVMQSTKAGSEPSPQDVEAIGKFGLASLLVSSDEVIRQWQELLRSGARASGPNAPPPFRDYARIFLAIRRDMGTRRTTLSEQEAIQAFVLASEWDDLAQHFI